MPFIDSKITCKVSEDKKEAIKASFGQMMALINKSEGFLMVGFDDEYCLYMGGKKVEKGVFVSVSLYGSASSEAYDKMTAEICRVYQEQLDIPPEKVYVTYAGFKDWGWNGKNF